MSASNWAFCPRCMQGRAEALAFREAEVQAMYGRVPVEEFDAARRSLEAAKLEGIREERDETFREDYEIWGAEGGVVKVRYRGACESCGLSLAFEHEHELFRDDSH